jgi:hypothetical protein
MTFTGPAAARAYALQQSVLRYLRREQEPRTMHELERSLGRQCHAAIRVLHERGLVEAVGMPGPRVRAGWRAVQK